MILKKRKKLLKLCKANINPRIKYYCKKNNSMNQELQLEKKYYDDVLFALLLRKKTVSQGRSGEIS